MNPLYLNGKFTAQRTTGVQRVAAQLVRALDAQVRGSCVLLCPPGAAAPPLRHIEVRHVGRAGLPLHLWEQWTLPRAAADGLLVSLAGSAPAWARHQVAMLHDAAVFDHPQAYTRAFAAWYRWLFRHLARRADGLLTVSAFSRARLAYRLQVPPQRLQVVPNGADHLDAVSADASVLDRHGLRGTPFLLAVGSANPNKNLAAMVQAFGRLPQDAGLRLVIVGGGNDRVFAGSASGHGVAPASSVLHLGPLDDAPLKALYQHALALVFPSLYEGFGLPPLEAMACGCPVVASHAAAIPEVCGDAALYFDPRSQEGLVAALCQITGDAALRERLIAAGQAQARRFRWSAAAAELLSLLPAEASRERLA
jgi:glycosyltransferase involved in cell wall biosynthesis